MQKGKKQSAQSRPECASRKKAKNRGCPKGDQKRTKNQKTEAKPENTQ